MKSVAFLALSSAPTYHFKKAPRDWRGQMCGIRIPGAPAIPGGAADPSLILTWFYDRYVASFRTQIRNEWRKRGITHIMLSWPDSQDYGYTPQQFRATCLELQRDGFHVCVFLSAKPTSSDRVVSESQTYANIMLVLPLLLGVVPMFCVGWELSLWLSPTDVQMLIDAIAPQVNATGAVLYVHFQEGYFAFQQDGGTTADFWWIQVGNPPKLRGVLFQRDLSWDKPMLQARAVDGLQRFAGQFSFPPHSGDGTAFDYVGCELTAMNAFNDGMGEAEQNSWGQTIIAAGGVMGPVGLVRVMGSGNGF